MKGSHFMSIEPHDQKRLTAAEGYLELGMLADAEAELGQVALEAQLLPQALLVRLGIYQGLANWPKMQIVARKLAQFDPDNSQIAISLAYATRRVEGIEAARVILIEAVRKHPDEPIIHYNLACYDCQLGKLDSALQFLARAMEIAPECRAMAFSDPDLAPLKTLLHT